MIRKKDILCSGIFFEVDASGNCTFGGTLSTAVDLSGLSEAAVAAWDYFVFFELHKLLKKKVWLNL